MSVKKITYDEFERMGPFSNSTWSHIYTIQTELTRLESMVQGRETMTVEDIESFIQDRWIKWTSGHNTFHGIAMELQPLTVPQGFVPDWSSVGDSVKGLVTITTPFDEASARAYGEVIQYIPRPTPPKKMRKRTDLELVGLALRHLGSWEAVARKLIEHGSLTDLCTAAGISLETEEA